MGSAEEKKRLKLDKLYDTAFGLFTDKGVSKTTIAEIAEKAGVAKGTFYLYFRDKFDLRDRLVAYKANQIFDEALLQMNSRRPKKFEDQLWMIFRYAIEILEKNPLILSFMAKDLSWGIVRKAPEESRIRQMYREALKRHHIICRDPELMLFTIVELVGSTCNSCILYHEPATMEEYLPWLKEAVYKIMDMYLIREKTAEAEI